MAFSGLDPFKLTGIERTKNELGTGSYASVYELNYLGLSEMCGQEAPRVASQARRRYHIRP